TGPAAVEPPAMSTEPSGSSVAVWPVRGVSGHGPTTTSPRTGSNRALGPLPPTNSTELSGRSVAVCSGTPAGPATDATVAVAGSTSSYDEPVAMRTRPSRSRTAL